LLQDRHHQLRRVGSDRFRPTPQLGRGPFPMPAVGGWHVLNLGDGPSTAGRPWMAGYSFSPVQDFHQAVREADIHRLPNQRVRDTVVVAVDLDMVVEIDLGFPPLSKLITLR